MAAKPKESLTMYYSQKQYKDTVKHYLLQTTNINRTTIDSLISDNSEDIEKDRICGVKPMKTVEWLELINT